MINARTIDTPVEGFDRVATPAEVSSLAQTESTRAWIETIQLLRFPLGLAVVTVHSGEFVLSLSRGAATGASHGHFSVWLVEFLTMVCRLATPAFLVIAGFVFFREGNVTLDSYRRKLKSRFHTLLVPYVAWNFIMILLLCAPAACKYFFSAPGIYTYVPLTLGGLAKWMIGWPIYPADAPLWFVRDLLLLILVAPLLFKLPKRIQLAGLGALLAYWLLGPVDLIPGGIPRAASTFFFLAGAWMGIHHVSLRPGPLATRIAVAAAAVCLASAIAGATVKTLGLEHLAAQIVFIRLVRFSGAVLVVCAGTRLSLPGWLSSRLRRLSPAAFFLYAFHYCVFSAVIAKVSKYYDGRPVIGNEPLIFGLVFTSVVAVSMACHGLLKRHAPSLLGLLDGNRSAGGSTTRELKQEVELSPLSISARRAPLFE